ncbi:MAG TPA: endonuclease, partial [Methanocorpusculum sp.]|nr:endonuclease [Methanocorpusculum sp.]
MREISRSVRLAHSVKTRMLFACIYNDEIIPVEFARIKL